MAPKKNITSVFPNYLFWDVDINTLDAVQDYDFIIPRALYMTNKKTFEADIKRLEFFYTPSQIIKSLQKTKELISNEVCHLVATKYKVPVFFRFKVK